MDKSVQTNKQTNKQTNMHICIHAYMHTCLHAYMHTCIHASTHTYIIVHSIPFHSIALHSVALQLHHIHYMHWRHFMHYVHYMHYIHNMQYVTLRCITSYYIASQHITLHLIPCIHYMRVHKLHACHESRTIRVWNSFRIFLSRFGIFFLISWLVPFA